MSRQFDDSQIGKFELCGEEYEIIEPTNFIELMEALKIKEIIKTGLSALMHDEDPTVLNDALEMQEQAIQGYVDSLEEFDNRILVKNINYLTKSNGLKLGELESFLGISAGYISRTAKENSAKKMSIDIVWKIAQFFETDIRTLTEIEMWVSHENIDLLEQFLEKLCSYTRNNLVDWTNGGGAICALDERYEKMGLVSETDGDECRYKPEHLSEQTKWLVYKDIFSLEIFSEKKDFVIIPYQVSGRPNLTGYDCYMVWEQDEEWVFQKVLFTSEDPIGSLMTKVDELYKLILRSENDIKLESDVKSVLQKYVNGVWPL